MSQIWKAFCEFVYGDSGDEQVIRSYGPLRLCCDRDYLNLYFYIHKTLAFRIFQLGRSVERDAMDLYCIFENKLPVLYDAMACRYSDIESYKKVCMTIKNNISYTPAHIAAKANVLGVYSHKGIHQYINSKCDAVAPIHVALKLESNNVLIELLQCGASILCLDCDGNNIVHLSTKLQSSFLCAICQYSNPCELVQALNAQNSNGETPLHLVSMSNDVCKCTILLDRGAAPAAFGATGTPVHYACKYQSTDVLKLLLKEDPSVVDEVCEKYAAIPMHWCRCSSEAELLVQANSLLNYESKTGHHPIHVMANYGRLEMVIFLISNNVNINLIGPRGNTALHCAACAGHEYVMKVLMSFGASVTIKNFDSLTPYKLAIHHCSKPTEIDAVVLNVLSGDYPCCRTTGLGYVNPSTSRDCFTALVVAGRTLLSFDGGGIRSIILCKILMEIEKKAKRPVISLFDWITGTGFGGNLALALCNGISAKNCLFMYFQMKSLIFDGEQRPYPSVVLDYFLKEFYGEKMTMMALKNKPRVIIPVTLVDRMPPRLQMFRNYDERIVKEEIQCFDKAVTKEEEIKLRQRITENVECSTPVWKVARYSFSAPTYFHPVDNYLDGSIVSNNPTLDAIVEINNLKHKNDCGPPVGVVVSLGTGRKTTTKIKYACKPVANLKMMTRVQLQEIAIDGACETNAHVVDRARSWCDTIGALYFRLDPCLLEDVALDETNNERLVDMLWTTHLYILNNMNTITEICSLLLDYRPRCS